MTEPPVWLLDIDGVINANKPGWSAPPRRVRIAGFMIRWAPALIDRIRELRRDGAVDVRWASTWCGYPTELDQLSACIGLRLDPAFGDRAASKTWGDEKAEAALDVIRQGRRLIWTDDDEVDAARDLFPLIAKAEADSRALLIAPRSNRGLQPAHLDQIAEFAAGA